MNARAVSVISATVLLLAAAGAGCQSPTVENGCVDFPEFPRSLSLTVRESSLSVLPSFEIASGITPVAVLGEELLGSVSFSLRDPRGNAIASIQASRVESGHHLEVLDCHGRRLGTLHEDERGSRILDGAGRLLALSTRIESAEAALKVTSPSGAVLAEMRRTSPEWAGDVWEVVIRDTRGLDPRVAVLLPALKTSHDHTHGH